MEDKYPIKLMKDGEMQLHFGINYIRLIPLARTNNNQYYYPIIKLDANVCITGDSIKYVKDVNSLLKAEFISSINHTIRQLEHIKQFIGEIENEK